MAWSTVQCTFKKKDCIDQPNSTKRPEGPQKTIKVLVSNLELLILNTATSHWAANPSNAHWRLPTDEARRTTS